MSLNELKLKKIYRSKQDNVTDEFLVPLLRESCVYDRGSGYFTIDSLASLADGLIPFVQNNGIIRIITSVELSEKDISTIKNGLKKQDDLIIEKIRQEIEEDIHNKDTLVKLDFLTNLIAAGILVIKIAYLPDGIYHEKIGICVDRDGNKVYFSGSNNATVSGQKNNWESFTVLTSWWGDSDTIDDQQKYFNSIWDNNEDGINVMPFPEAEKKNLLRKYKVSHDVQSATKRLQNAIPGKKKKKEPYEYQKIAIAQFLNNDGKHFFEMATGTGKTFTSVKAALALYKEKGHLSVIVIVPQVDLQPQWEKAFADENVKARFLGGYSNSTETDYNFSSFIINSYADTSINVLISTYDTFFAKFVKQCEKIGDRTLFIVDEAHNLSPAQIRRLPTYFKYRLGLSATPERYSLKETEKIVQYFTEGGVQTYKYTIDEAIEKGFLCHYQYSPLFVNITDDEFASYQNYTKQVVVALNQDPRDDDLIKDLLTKRSSIIKKSASKLVKLRDIVTSKNYNFKNSVVYCGHGKDRETEVSIIDSVTRILALEGHYSVAQFTAHATDRANIIKEFEDGNFDVLAAIKCFDEGVDVPKLDKIYIMASDGLNRQTIQRRGRVLRTCTDTGKEIAKIYDFVALPPLGITEGVGVSNLVINEIKRVKEYARLADNCDNVQSEVAELLEIYNISEEDINHESIS